MIIFSDFFGDNAGQILFSKVNTNATLILILLLICFSSFIFSKKLKRFSSFPIFYLFILIFLLSPIRLRYSMEWPNHANWGWIILYISFLYSFLKNPLSSKIKYPILAGIFFFIALTENTYHGVELFFISILLFIFSIFFNKKSIFKKENTKIVLKNLLIFSGIVFASVCYQYYVYTLPVQYGTSDITTVISSASRSPSDRWAYSARPWHYLIPDIDHPILGDIAVKAHYWIWQHPPYYLTEPFFPKEHTLFLGYTLMALTLYTIWQTYIKKRIKNAQRFTVTFFLIILVTAFIFSMPPYIAIGELKIYFPSHFIYQVLPQFRAYARYGVFVFIANTIIAMIGLSHLVKSSFIKHQRKKIYRTLLTITIGGLALFEFMPSFPSISIDPIPPYTWLKTQSSEQIKYMEVPTRRDYTDHLYTFESNLTSLNPYLKTPIDVEEIEKSLWDIDREFATPYSLWCNDFADLGGKYIMYHKKDLIKQKYVDLFTEKGVVTDQLKVALAESWGDVVWGNHVPKDERDLSNEARKHDIEKLLGEHPLFNVVAEFSNDEIIASRPNKNFSADKFDEVVIFEINQSFCSAYTKP